MTDLGFTTTPSNKSCSIGSKLALENANRHYRCAIHINENGEFGMAIPHLVLSVEEAIKAAFLFIKGLGIPILQEDLNDLLYNHKPRHEVGGAFHFMFAIGQWTTNTLQAAHERMTNKTESDKIIIRHEAIIKISDELRKAADDDNSELARIILPVIKWWKKANHMKNAGFYVDFQKNQWLTPALFNKEDYDQSLDIAKKAIDLVNAGFDFVEWLPIEDKTKLIKDAKKEYKKSVKVHAKYKKS